MNAQTDQVDPPKSGSTGSGGTRPAGNGRPQTPPRPPPADAIRDAFSKFNELKEFAAYYASVRMDMLKATVRNLGIYLALGIFGLIAVGAMAVTAVVLLLQGIAGAFAQLFSGHPWLGDIITSVLVLGLMAGAIVFVMKKLTGTFRSQTVKKYEDRLRRERQELGRDVHERAVE